MSYKPADRVLRSLITDAIVDLCRKQSFYVDELRIEATVCIISDRSSVVIAQITEQVGDKTDSEGEYSNDKACGESKTVGHAQSKTTKEVEKSARKRGRNSVDCTLLDDVDGKLEGKWECDEATIQQLELATSQHIQSQQQVFQPDLPALYPFDLHSTAHGKPSASPRGANPTQKTYYPLDGSEFLNQLVECGGFQRSGVGADGRWEAGGKRVRARHQAEKLPAAYDADGTMVDGTLVQRAPDGKYPCPYCDKTYGFRHTLKDHINTHLGRRPHACKHCPVAFAHLASLCAHIKRRHDDIISNDHQCALCGEKFSNVQSLKQHHTWRHRADTTLCTTSVTATTSQLNTQRTMTTSQLIAQQSSVASAKAENLAPIDSIAKSLSKLYDPGNTDSGNARLFRSDSSRDDLLRKSDEASSLGGVCAGREGDMWTPSVEDCSYDDLDISVTKIDGPWAAGQASSHGSCGVGGGRSIQSGVFETETGVRKISQASNSSCASSLML